MKIPVQLDINFEQKYDLFQQSTEKLFNDKLERLFCMPYFRALQY